MAAPGTSPTRATDGQADAASPAMAAGRRRERRERLPVDQRPWLFADEVALVEGIDQSQVYRNVVAGRYGQVCRTVGGGVRILKSAVPLWPAWEAMWAGYDAGARPEPAGRVKNDKKEASYGQAGTNHP
ncbi:MAG TPA: hypothetical protein VFS62_11885 [Chloroflexota bacterium]|nr:hypothetical protein [Chloroflexota bacterium]